MPRQSQSEVQPEATSLTGLQTATKHFMLFAEFQTMNTQSQRQALPPQQLAWCENVQIVAPNNLVVVPGPNTALATLTGKTITSQFFASFGPAGMSTADYTICFNSDGSAIQVNDDTGAQVVIAAAGTFSASPDMTTWASQRILIFDTKAGYATWDGSVFVFSGGVSPFFVITAGGSGYTTPTVTISGGSGSGATGTVQVTAGVVTGITLTAAGSGYKAGDTITVTINPVGGGSGATATGRVWPFFTFPANSVTATIAVFSGRVWLASGRILSWTGTGGPDDAALADASGTTVLTDADLVHNIYALRNFNNFLYIFGDNSVKQIGAISVTGSTTLFTIITLSSDQGTTFKLSIASYNRLVIFANHQGVFAVFGASVEKISDPMDGIFLASHNIVFPFPLQAALQDLNSIHCYCLLFPYPDPLNGGTIRSLILTFMNNKWFVISAGDNVISMSSAPMLSTLQMETFVSSGSDLTMILQQATTPVKVDLRTALWHDKKPHMDKRIMNYGMAVSGQGSQPLTMTTTTENNKQVDTFLLPLLGQWINNAGVLGNWINNAMVQGTWVSNGFVFLRRPAQGTGIYLGLEVTGTFSQTVFNNLIIQYQDATVMASRTSV